MGAGKQCSWGRNVPLFNILMNSSTILTEGGNESIYKWEHHLELCNQLYRVQVFRMKVNDWKIFQVKEQDFFELKV